MKVTTPWAALRSYYCSTTAHTNREAEVLKSVKVDISNPRHHTRSTMVLVTRETRSLRLSA